MWCAYIHKAGLRGFVWVIFSEFRQWWQEGGDDFQFQVLLIAVAVGPPLQDTDLVVEAFDQTEADLVVGITVGSDTIPMAFDHASKLAVGFQPLPLQGVLPTLEESPCAAFGAVVPQLPEGLLEQIGGIEPLVSGEQFLEGVAAVQGEVLAAGKQHIAIALDVGAVLASQALVLASTHFVEGIGEVAHDVELVEDDTGIGDVAGDRVAEWLPHVHHGQFDMGSLFRPQISEKAVEVGLLAALAANPDRTAAFQVADNDPVVVALADGDLVNADGPRGGPAGALHLLLHVELIEVLDRAMVQALHVGDRLVRHVAAQLAHMQGKALGVARVLCQPVEVLYMHATAPRTVDAPALELQVDAQAGNREVAHAADAFIVTASAAVAAA